MVKGDKRRKGKKGMREKAYLTEYIAELEFFDILDLEYRTTFTTLRA